MIACTPIHPKIRNKLNAKMEVLGRTSPPANTETSTNELKTEDVFTKSTFIRMTSHVASPMKPIILMGGELFDGKMKVGVDSSSGNANESITDAERGSVYGRSYGQTLTVHDIQTMAAELQSKVKQYDTEASAQTDEENARRLQEVQGMEQSIRQYQNQAQQELQKKEFDLLKPITEKAQAAIIKVAKAQGFDYVLDSTQGQGVIFADGKNLIEDVKTELGF